MWVEAQITNKAGTRPAQRPCGASEAAGEVGMGRRPRAMRARRAEQIEQWADQPGRARPTPERRKRGGYRLVAGEDAGIRVAYDERSTPIRDAYASGKLTARQLDAGEKFEELYRVVMGSPGPRSCLDWSPRGHSESEPEYAARAWAEWKALGRSMSSEVAAVMFKVCCMHEPTRRRCESRKRWRMLCEGLDAAADYWGLPQDGRKVA